MKLIFISRRDVPADEMCYYLDNTYNISPDFGKKAFEIKLTPEQEKYIKLHNLGVIQEILFKEEYFINE